MLKQEVSMLQEGRWPRSCDACRAVASVVFCRADALFLCSSCDSQAHAPGGAASRHERVWVCEACEQAPAVFACKADAAALCATCDMDVHSNPLASRHTRVPVLPITGDTASERERGGATVSPFLTGYVFGEETEAKGQASTLAWPFIFDSHGNYENRSYVDFLTGNEVEEYRDLGEYKPSMETMREGGYVQEYDGLELHNDAEKRYGYDHHVPAQFAGQPEERRSLDVGLGFGVPKVEITEPFALSYSISPSSIEERVVPDNTTDIKSSKLETTPSKGTLDLPEHNAERTAAAQSDRQARVLRYREKKKRRNFEKTIRYASRKAYAEIRPRIKGRFTKRIDPEQSADRMLHTTISAELTYEYTCGYGVVPSF